MPVIANAGTCPSGANYLSTSMDALTLPLVTLASLGVTNCFYVAAAGADTNTGADETHPWAHAPGMPTCTSNCAAHTKAPGDGYILKGGDTWHAANFPWVMNVSGTAANPIYVGVDITWFSGGSWTRPIWNADNNTGGVGAAMFEMLFSAYSIVDNFEVLGLNFQGTSTSTTCSAVFHSYSANDIIQNFYYHGITYTQPWANTNGPSSCGFLEAVNNGLTTARYNIMDMSDSGGAANAVVTFAGVLAVAYGNYIKNGWSGLDGCGDNWHDNVVDGMGIPVDAAVPAASFHQNAFKHLSSCTTPSALDYNNIVKNQVSWGGGGGAVKFWWNGGGTATTYAFNNLMFNNVLGNDTNVGSQAHVSQDNGTLYLFNNTFECGNDSALGSCFVGSNGQPSTSSMVLNLINDHWITTAVSSGTHTGVGGVISQCVATWTCQETDSLYQTVAQAAAGSQGYTSTSPFAFQPTINTGSTIQLG